jgi:hypothetical protein
MAAHPGRWWVLASGVLSVAVIGMYFFYFERTNARFATAAIKPNELNAELARWASWHWVRVAFCLAAFAAALMAV